MISQSIHLTLKRTYLNMDSILPTRGSSKSVLLLGAGFVTRPTAEELNNADINVTVGM